MNKVEYLKLAITDPDNVAYRHDWMFSVLAVTRMEKSDKPYKFQLFCTSNGYEYFTPEGTYEVIDGIASKGMPTEALFTIFEKIPVDNSWTSNIASPCEISIGNIIGNKILIHYPFGNKIPCPTGPITIDEIEKKVGAKLKDTPSIGESRSEEFFYVDELLKFNEALQTLKSLASLISYAATPKNLVAPTGIDAFKATLNKEFAGRDMDDPLTFAEYENRLKDFDKEYMKDDPTMGKFTAGRAMGISRKKMFLTVGADQLKFNDAKRTVAVMNSLREGWPTKPREFVAMCNSARVGSYARGAETVNGGVAAKILSRAGSNYTLVDTDCKSSIGVTRLYGKNNINKLIGVSVITGSGKTELVLEDQKGKYLGAYTTTRSPFGCKLKGENICRVCIGEKLFRFKNGASIFLMETSSIILAASMAAMHGKILSTAEIDLERHFS